MLEFPWYTELHIGYLDIWISNTTKLHKMANSNLPEDHHMKNEHEQSFQESMVLPKKAIVHRSLQILS